MSTLLGLNYNWVGYTRKELQMGWIHYDTITAGLDTLGQNHNWIGYTGIELQLCWLHQDTIADGLDKLG